MGSQRLTFALANTKSDHWRAFEIFASAFHVDNYPSLQTTATTHGDKGRDGQLFLPLEDSKTMLQYSVTVNWASKIRKTKRRLEDSYKSVTRLIYCTPVEIGAAGDALVEEFRKNKVALEIHDRSWFVDRASTTANRQAAVDELCELIVDPLLSNSGIGKVTGLALDREEARVALLHLSLDGYDATSDRNLTKSSYESLVLASLNESSATNLKSEGEIVASVSTLIPTGDRSQVKAQVKGALARLSKKGGPIKFLRQEAKYHLAHEVSIERQEVESDFLTGRLALLTEIKKLLANDEHPAESLQQEAERLLESLEGILLDRGEAFVNALNSVDTSELDIVEVINRSTESGAAFPWLTTNELRSAVIDAFNTDRPAARNYLMRLADAYTLFAFLQQTADVQSAVVKIFSDAELWLDATIILQLISESLEDDTNARRYHILLAGARRAGFKLYVTEGVLQEIETHLYNSLTCSRVGEGEWRTQLPFIFRSYVLSGRAPSSFASWLDSIRGNETPEDDVAEYLEDQFDIHERSLADEAAASDPEVRSAAQVFWQEAHERRRGGDGILVPDLANISLLADHDVEMTMGIMHLRSAAKRDPRGHRQWLFTLDRAAYRLHRVLCKEFPQKKFTAVTMSPDFLVQLLRIGPLRTALDNDVRISMPLVIGVASHTDMPSELLSEAARIREELRGKEERVIRRHVRERLNALRSTDDPGSSNTALIAERNADRL